MKRIIFILSMLVSVAYGQSIGYWRYDTIVLQKIGGNSELKVMNATRGVTGGVLTNMGNGRTAFVTPAATTKAKSGTTLAGDTVILGGTTLDRYSAIGLNGFPLTLIRNGLINSTRSDSNGIVLRNNSLWASSTDTMISPGYTILFNSRKTLGGVASQPIEFTWDGLGTSSASLNGYLRLSSKKNNGAPATLYTIDANGVWGQNLNIQGATYGIGSGGAGGIAIGVGSPLQVQTAGAASNIAIGSGAQVATTTGSYNVGIGDNALGSNTTGPRNTAVGFRALSSSTSSVGLNTAIGADALVSNTTGEQNTTVGANAGRDNTTGSKNGFFGTAAGELNTTGSNNTFNGHDAGLQNTTGSDNIGIGHVGNSQNRTGNGSIGIGNSSARGLVNSNHMVSIGLNSNYLQWSGAAIPEDTLRNSIAIGTHAFNTASNQIMLGSDSISTAFMYGIASGAGTKAVRYNPTTKQLFYADTTTGGGGGGSQGLQDVITVDPVLTGTNTIDINTGNLVFTNGSFIVNSTNTGNVALSVNSSDETFMASPDASNQISVRNTGHFFEGLASGFIDTTNYKPVARHISGQQIVQMNSWAQVGGGGGSGVTTMAAIGASPNANGATISGSNLNLEPASGSFGGVVTTGTQTFAGVKTFSGQDVHSAGMSISGPYATNAGMNMFYDGGSNLGGITMYDGAYKDFRLISNIATLYGGGSNPGVLINTSGNVGIGTSSSSDPTSSLTVKGSFAPNYVATAIDRAAAATDYTIEITATGRTVTLPTAVGIAQRVYVIKLTASGSGTVATTSSQTIDGSTTYSLASQYKYVTVQSNGANWIIIGNN